MKKIITPELLQKLKIDLLKMNEIDDGQNPLVEKIMQVMEELKTVETLSRKQAIEELLFLSSQYFCDGNIHSAYKKNELKEQIILLLEILSNQELKIRYKDSDLAPDRLPLARDALNQRFFHNGLPIRICSSNKGTRLVEIPNKN